MKSKTVPQKPPEILLWEEQFSCTSDSSIEEYVSHLESNENYRLNADIIDRGQKFEVVLQSYNRLSSGWLVGEIELADNKLTIQGKVGIGPEIIFLAPIVPVIFVVFALLSLPESSTFSLVLLTIALLFLLVLAFSIRYLKQELLRIIQHG